MQFSYGQNWTLIKSKIRENEEDENNDDDEENAQIKIACQSECHSQFASFHLTS